MDKSMMFASKRDGGNIAMRRQAGASLMEMMIGLALSLVVVASMIALMSNSVGSATRITQMSQLTDELRNTMSMLARDVRRANYNANSIYCFANASCGKPGNAAVQAEDIEIDPAKPTEESCIVFGLDRNFDGDGSVDNAGAFRWREVSNDSNQLVGQIEMWVGGAEPDCDQNMNSTEPELPGDWIAITDPGFVDITEFSTDDSELASGSFTLWVPMDNNVNLIQRIRSVRIQMVGQLNLDNTIQRRVVDTIRLRNDFYELK